MKQVFLKALAAVLAFLAAPDFLWAAARQGGTLTMAIRRDLEVLNPLVNTRPTDRRVRELMYEPLLRGIDLKGRVQPNLAVSWEVQESGRLYVFSLRRGVKFHNSQEMTAEDVKFAIDYTLNPKNGARGFNILNVISQTEAADRYTLKVYLKGPSPGFLSSLTDIRAFSMIPKGSLLEGTDKPGPYPPGTGPFKFLEWQPQQKAIFERFAEYWGQKPLLDRLVLRPIKDATVRFTALRAGDVDMVEETPYEWVRQIVDGKIKGIHYAVGSHQGHLSLQFNVAAPFNNKKLRQAVAHAIDRSELLAAAFFGLGEPSDQKYPKDHLWYLEAIPSLRYDPERAKGLLKEAGYNGQPIEFLTNQGDESKATSLQAQLKRIGMNVKIEILEGGAYSARERRGEFAFKFSGGIPIQIRRPPTGRI